MTQAEKLTMLQGICGDSEADSAMLSVYLDLAADIVVHRAYPFLTNYVLAEVPNRYATLQVQIANELYLHRGAEGERIHTENGISRTYEDGYVSTSLLKKIVPFTRTIGEAIPEDISIVITGKEEMSVGETYELLVYTEVVFTNGESKEVNEGYSYGSSDESVATIEDGVITALTPGDVTITVTGKRSEMSQIIEIKVV